MALIENEKDLLVALQAEFGGRQFKFKRVLKTIHKHSDGFIHSTKIFAMLRRLVEDGKLNEIERMKYKILPVEGKAMKTMKMNRVKIKNRTAKRITASVGSVFAKKAGKPKKKGLGKTPAELKKMGKSIDKMTTSITKLRSDIKGVNSTIKKLHKQGVKLGRIPTRLESLAGKLHKTMSLLEETATLAG